MKAGKFICKRYTGFDKLHHVTSSLCDELTGSLNLTVNLLREPENITRSSLHNDFTVWRARSDFVT